MAFEFNCVHCGYYLKTDDQEIAEATQCPVCGNAVESPSDASALPPGIGVGDDLSGQDNAPEPSAQSVSPGRLEIDDVFSTAWAMFKDRMGIVVGGVWIHAIVLGIFSTPTSIAQSMLQENPPPDLVGVLVAVVIGGNILSLLLGAYMNGGLMLFLLKLARGEGAEIADIFRGGRYFGRMLLCTICFGIVVGLGFVACVLPGVILMLTYGVYQWVLVDRDPSGLLDALSQAKQVTNGHKLQLLVIGVAIMGINIAGMLACCVGYIFTIPFSNLIMAVAYLRMTGQPTIMDVGWPSANEQPTAEIQDEDHSW